MVDCKDDSIIGQRMKFYQTFNLTTLHPFILFVICEVGLSGHQLHRVFLIFWNLIPSGVCYAVEAKEGQRDLTSSFPNSLRGFRVILV